MRAFIGVALPNLVRLSLTSLQRRLAESRADVKWVEPSNLHVTMRFLGEIDEARDQLVSDALRRVAVQSGAFETSLSRLGTFPSGSSPRVIWVGIERGQEELVRIAELLERQLTAIGLPGDNRRFVAHVTLGRVRSDRDLGQLVQALSATEWPAPPPWSTAAVTLYRSKLSPEGPHYTALLDVPLGAVEEA